MTKPKRPVKPRKADGRKSHQQWDGESRARALEAVYERIRNGAPMVVAAACEGIPPSTWDDWRANDPDVKAASDLARLVGSELQREKLEIEMDSGGLAQEAKARMHWMGILYRDVYAPVDKREISGPDGGPVPLSTAIEEALAKRGARE